MLPFTEFSALRNVFGSELDIRLCFFHVSRNVLKTLTDYIGYTILRTPDPESRRRRMNGRVQHHGGDARHY
jgi:hypothetical protein